MYVNLNSLVLNKYIGHIKTKIGDRPRLCLKIGPDPTFFFIKKKT